MLVMDTNNIKELFLKLGYKRFFQRLVVQLQEDFSHWDEFEKVPRVATHSKVGVIELMPISNNELYSFKYVNGHPKNPTLNKSTVMAYGALSNVNTGEPILLSEMTILTALRTAAISAVAGSYLAKKNSRVMTLIGTGAQSEFQTLAFSTLFDIHMIRYFDIDDKAMQKYEKNMCQYDFELIRCTSVQEAVKGSHIVTTITADKTNQTILTLKMLHKGIFINGVGGDCPGKTELEKEILQNAKIVVEYLEQTKEEGEIQQVGVDAVYCELHELIRGKKIGRVNDDEITLFDSVGFALEDYSILKVIYDLALEYGIGNEIELIPSLDDPKDLFFALT